MYMINELANLLVVNAKRITSQLLTWVEVEVTDFQMHDGCYRHLMASIAE